MKSKFFFRFKLLTLVLALTLFLTATSSLAMFDFEDLLDGQPGEVYTMVDEKGNVIMRTARKISEGDEYIDQKNNHYRVKSVVQQRAEAELIEKTAAAQPEQEGLIARVQGLLLTVLPVQRQGEEKTKRIAIYSSHGAESYIEGDGTESKDPGGGILDVADRLQAALEKKGVEVIRSRQPHTPHDAGAYQRSRRTAEEALKESPDAIIDVHRDAVPEEEYLGEVNGEERVQVQLVVGRQNQNIANNRQFAEGLKKQADQKYPGLVKGIFMARGNYNQDLSPTAALIEVGSHTNDKEQAMESMDLFAEVVTDYLYGTAEGQQASGPSATTSKGPGGTALKTVLWLVVGVIVAVAAYLLISTGGIEQFKARIQKFIRREMNFLGGPGKPDDDDGGTDGS
ncbi:MAG: stage II sporulation protein P [Firmicutes bacterium]|nr:stage II sporulation protein P [Bacillota bacterium]